MWKEDQPTENDNDEDSAVSSPSKLKKMQFDESIRISDVHWQSCTLPPTLYVDDYSVMTEVSNLRTLREGDHCVVGLNVLHNLFPMVDAWVSRLTSLEALPIRLYHHFVIVDSVADVTEDGPVRADGAPVRIAEFSETPAGAYRRITADGYKPSKILSKTIALLASPAQYHLPPLVSYLPPSRRKGCRGNGIFLIHQELSDEQRRQTRNAALALADGLREPAEGLTYRLMTGNCEHIANMVNAQTQRSVSPQVSHQLWCGIRILLQVVSMFFLATLSLAPFEECPYIQSLLAAVYHLFGTVPVVAQTQVHLVRTCVNLTQRRHTLGQVAYNYLIVKETVRAMVVGGTSITALALMPRFVWDTNCLRTACFISLTVYGGTSVIFNLTVQVLVRALLKANIGVPVLLFDDLRNVKQKDTGADSISEASEPEAEADCSGTTRSSQEPAEQDAESEVRRRHPIYEFQFDQYAYR